MNLNKSTKIPRVKVAILGAGFGGLGLAIRLRQNGEDDFLIIDRNEDVGGTWLRNTYPGCACDVPSRLYWPYFVRQPDWSRVYASQPEILENIRAMVREEGIVQHLRLGVQVTSAAWNEGTRTWTLSTSGGPVCEADIFVCAVGQLSEPKLPALDGLDDFKGESFHTASWDHSVDLAGKKVGVIGTGASAIQVVPQLADVAEQVWLFQRSAPYVLRKNDQPYSAEERAMTVADKDALMTQRAAMLRELDERVQMFAPGSEGPAFITGLMLDDLAQTVQDGALREALTPDYVFACKRPLLSDDYFATFNRPNVKLINSQIERITDSAIILNDGRSCELDVIVHATGFDALHFLKGLNIQGIASRSLHDEAWAIAPEAHKGITVAGFPSFFMIFGPNTNYVSVLAMMEVQFDFILKALHLFDEADVVIEPRAIHQAEYNHWLQERLASSPFSADCGGYYKHPSGRVTSNWWGPLDDYRQLMGSISPNEYRFHSRSPSRG